MAEPITISGLNEFVRNIKKLDNDLPKALRVAFNSAADIVVGYAKERVPRRSGNAAASIRARSTQTSVRVVAGGKKAPYYPWLDFGGKVGRKKSVKRPFFKDGRYLYEGLYNERDKIRDATISALLEAAKAAGFEVE